MLKEQVWDTCLLVPLRFISNAIHQLQHRELSKRRHRDPTTHCHTNQPLENAKRPQTESNIHSTPLVHILPTQRAREAIPDIIHIALLRHIVYRTAEAREHRLARFGLGDVREGLFGSDHDVDSEEQSKAAR